MNGLLVIDKPGGMTSRDVVNTVQRWFPRKTKIGHTGTLDPLATGVLVVCVGAATRLADHVQSMGKAYASRFRLGATSTTDDADGAVTQTPGAVPPTREALESTAAEFVGTIRQVPPAFSALKVDGERAHALARQGRGVELAARPVRVDAIRLVNYDWPFADVVVECGKGTYIRSLARDIGARLGCGGMVQTLRRTRIGPFTAEQCVGLDATPDEVRAALLPMSAAVAGLPSVSVTPELVERLRRGQRISGGELPQGAEVALLTAAGEVVAIGVVEHGQIQPRIVLGTAAEPGA